MNNIVDTYPAWVCLQVFVVLSGTSRALNRGQGLMAKDSAGIALGIAVHRNFDREKAVTFFANATWGAVRHNQQRTP